MNFKLNGEDREYTGDPDLPLLTYLREHEGIISPKDGCAPQAACGCCAVQVNDKALLSCVTPMKKVAGSSVITTEGMSEYHQNIFANAFVEKGGVQCGFCIPGIVMQSKALLDKNPDPTRADVEQALTPHLCRCTGYKKIVDAVMLAADAMRKEEEIPLPRGDGKVGSRQPRYDASRTVLGQRPYVADMKLDGMLYGALKFSDHPRARVLRIDVSAASQLPGVVRIFTAADIPGDKTIGLIKQDWPLMIGEGEVTHYIGDVLAGVVAESESIARQAVAQLVVEYEVLEPVVDAHEALEAHSPLVHQAHENNVLSHMEIKRGDADAALAASAFVAEGIYQTQTIEHGFMEPECCIARPLVADTQAAGVEVFSQGQGIYEDQKQIAKLLDLPLEKVRVQLVPNGGGFGGKEDLSVQGHAALYAYHLQRPVRVALTRDESINMHPKRHPLWMEYSLGCDASGKLTAVKARIIGDSGAYASVGMKVLERAAGHATGAYYVPVVDVESTAVYTNNIPNGAMRGFGVNQATFALESCMDELCQKGGFDRWQFRYDNALVEGTTTSTGQVLKGGVGVRATLEAVKDEFYRAKFAGLACGIKNTGIGNGMPDASSVRISVVAAGNEGLDSDQRDVKVVIEHGWTEMGQGINTMAVQMLCEETGIGPDAIEVRIDTDAGTFTGMTTASRATSLLGNAILDAAVKLRTDLGQKSLPELMGNVYMGEWVVDWTTKPGYQNESGEDITHYSYSYATQLVVLDDEGQVQKVTAAHDAGRIINPTLFEGQIEGSIHMGLGYAISEELPYEGGRPKSTMLRKCGILRAKEMPEMEVVGVEVPDPHGAYGLKGVGEIGLVPTAGAVANALYQFDQERRHQLPMKLPRKRRS
ncbi:MAG: selenium-dependent xanthine dehydrogenase [Caldilineaceae bacterium]|nr:selenium-dependent xanthine dehydrogenase [Caldilineaceae bacterium]